MKIFITGITGTIGSALVKYLYGYHQIEGIDRNEEAVAKMRLEYPDINIEVGDFAAVDFSRREVSTLVHLAAMKHVDLCEEQVSSCVLNNVTKTARLFKNAHSNNVDILFMSTDKAVEPISMYGYSKALGEGLTREYGGTVVRSGNILESSGSVLNIWDEAIQNKKPVKVTHKDMVRYFISPENLVSQVWTRYIKGDKFIIPEMETKIKIIDLLAERLTEYGHSIKDYPGGIEYIGLRPGEKVFEKLDWGNRE